MKNTLLVVMFLLCSVSLMSQPTINGTVSDANYTTVATFTSGRDGFGSSNTLTSLKFYSDGTTMYFGIEGYSTSNDNIVLFLDFSGYGGRGTSTLAGSSSSSQGCFTTSGGGLSGAKMDAGFDVDYALAFNEGNGSSNIYVDGARFGSGSGGYLNTSYLGTVASQTGTSGTPSGGTDLSTAFGGSGSWTLAYNGGGSSNQGIEFSVPIAAFAGVTNTQTVQLFVLITSSTGFMSNECMPGDPGASNLGNNYDLSSISGQTFYTSTSALPVELTNFNALVSGKIVNLKWVTASEVNASGYDVERREAGNSNWNKIGFVSAKGTSNAPTDYSYADNTVTASRYQYRLKMIDNDGTYEYSGELNVSVGVVPGTFVLEQNYPNPFNPSTNIKFGFNESVPAKLTVLSLTGEEIEVLFDGRVEAGSVYNIPFNAEKLSSGVYLYKLTAPGYSSVRKMALLR